MITTAYAQQPGSTPATPSQTAAGPTSSLVMMVLIFMVFYFLLIRPQQKQQKLHRKMIADAKRGDEIVTTSGIFGKVTDVLDDHVKVQIDNDVNIKLDKNHIQSIKGYGEGKQKAS